MAGGGYGKVVTCVNEGAAGKLNRTLMNCCFLSAAHTTLLQWSYELDPPGP